jgi:hypothetical protein
VYVCLCLFVYSGFNRSVILQFLCIERKLLQDSETPSILIRCQTRENISSVNTGKEICRTLISVIISDGF